MSPLRGQVLVGRILVGPNLRGNFCARKEGGGAVAPNRLGTMPSSLRDFGSLRRRALMVWSALHARMDPFSLVAPCVRCARVPYPRLTR